jgi:hypothetical protein
MNFVRSSLYCSSARPPLRVRVGGRFYSVTKVEPQPHSPFPVLRRKPDRVISPDGVGLNHYRRDCGDDVLLLRCAICFLLTECVQAFREGK